MYTVIVGIKIQEEKVGLDLVSYDIETLLFTIGYFAKLGDKTQLWYFIYFENARQPVSIVYIIFVPSRQIGQSDLYTQCFLSVKLPCFRQRVYIFYINWSFHSSLVSIIHIFCINIFISICVIVQQFNNNKM